MAEALKAPFPAFVSALDLALWFLADGTLGIDEDGKVWRHKSGGRPVDPPRRAEVVDSKGYLRIVLGIPKQGKTCHVQAHVLVWTSLVGPIAEGLQINHKDCDKQNNRLENLEVTTQSGNIRHSYAHGRPRPWHKATMWQGRLRVTPEREAGIRALRQQGLLLREIAARVGLGTSHVWRIINKKAGSNEQQQ